MSSSCRVSAWNSRFEPGPVRAGGVVAVAVEGAAVDEVAAVLAADGDAASTSASRSSAIELEDDDDEDDEDEDDDERRRRAASVTHGCDTVWFKMRAGAMVLGMHVSVGRVCLFSSNVHMNM